MGDEIMVYALETCNRCNELRSKLDENDIQYQYINISKNNRLGDKLEEIYKCSSYPMVLSKAIIFLPYTSLSINPNIKTYNSIAELVQILNQ